MSASEEAIVMAAPIRIRQELVNLIDNGIKYTPSWGRVTVSAAFSADGDGAQTVTIRVSDTGLGIAARHLPHVFDKFYRVQQGDPRDRRHWARSRRSLSRYRSLSPDRTPQRFRSIGTRRSAQRRTARARPAVWRR